MADRSRSEINKTKLIGDGLNTLRDSFRSSCKSLGVPSSLQALDQIGNEGNKYGLVLETESNASINLQTLALALISALQILPASTTFQPWQQESP